MINFKTFIASSLKGEYINLREKIAEAIKELNVDKELSPMNFSSFRFESESSNAGCADGAQNEINLEIEESHGFILICDSNVGIKTVEEFQMALKRFKNHQNPTFILILKKKGDSTCGPNQITYEKFKSDNLSIFQYNEDGNVNDDYINYEYEFDIIEEATKKLKDDIKNWITKSKHRPLFKAELGRDVTPDFMYKDENRRKRCDERIYFHRHIDENIAQSMIADEPVILIKGASLSGKTRALYQAMKDFPDAWFYKFKERHDEKNIKAEIDEITGYISLSKCMAPLYLIIDDVHQFPSIPNIKYAMERLSEAITDKNVRIIMTSTSSDDIPLSPNKIIDIKPLNKKEYEEAELFFHRFGLTVESGYKEIGAMMIDLKGIKEQYESFAKIKDCEKRRARICLLKAIKASSIWHNSNLGNVENLFTYAKYLLESNGEKGEKVAKLLCDSINAMLENLSGISRDDISDTFNVTDIDTLPRYINIEEYIYRYVLDSFSVEKEWEAINQILSYSFRFKVEPIITSLSKFARRTENRKVIAVQIYDLIMGLYNRKENYSSNYDTTRFDEKEWYEGLKKELESIKEEVKLNSGKSNEECSEMCIHMAKIIWARMLYVSTYDEAEILYNSVPAQLQNLPMLGVLIYQSKGDMDKLDAIIKGKRVEDSFYIINKLIPYANSFKEAYEYFKKGKLLYDNDNRDVDYINSSKKLREILEKRETGVNDIKAKDICRQHFIQALNGLASKIRQIEELESLLDIIKEHYVILTDDIELAQDIHTKRDTFSKNKLTAIDLLSRLNLYSIRGAFSDILIWSNQVPFELSNLTDWVIEEFTKTSKLFTTGYKAKYTVSTIFNVFIEKCNECSYSDVAEIVFHKMHVQQGDNIVNLCDSFTYSGMMRIKSCKYIDALDLYRNYIEPHSKDPRNNFRITHFILNEILKKVKSSSEYEKVSRLFNENNVAKDIYTYNLALRNLSYSTCVKQILPQMCKENVEIDIFTLGTLISKAPNVKIAASFFHPLSMDKINIEIEDNMVPEGDTSKTLRRKIKEYTKELPLEKQHYLWVALVGSYCRNDEDRKTLFDILEYLEQSENRTQIFGKHDNGIIYNSCLKNSSLIRNYNEANEFIFLKSITPDQYTFISLVKILIEDNKNLNEDDQDTSEFQEELNCIYKRNKCLVQKQIEEKNTYIYNERMKAYRSHAEKMSLVFIFPNGKEDKASLTPMEYVKYLVDHNLPIDQYTFSCFAEIEKGQTYELLKEIIEFIKNHKLYVNNYAIDTLIKKFRAFIPDAERLEVLGSIYELPIKDNLVSQSKATINMFSHNLCSLEEAFERIKGNFTEMLFCYTQILTQFRKLNNGIEEKQGISAFSRCMELYEKHIKRQEIIPNASLFSNLANLTESIYELNIIFKELSYYKVKPMAYFITPIMRVSNSCNDVYELLKKYISLGGLEPGRYGSENEVDLILRGFGYIWRREFNAEIHKLISTLTDYILSSQPSCDILANFPFFSIYKENGGQLTQNALCELMNCWPYCDNQVEREETYLKRCRELLKRFYRPDNDSIRPKLVKAMAYVTDKLEISKDKIISILKPYPKLAFNFSSEVSISDYNTYRILIESWNDGFNKISQDYVIGVLLDLLGNDTLSQEKEQILTGIYSKWGTELSVTDFLKRGDEPLPTPKDITEYNENDKFRVDYLCNKFRTQLNGHRFSKSDVINLFINIFGEELSDNNILESELGYIIKKYNLKFDELKPVLEAISENKKGILTVLNYMTDKLTTYNELYFIIKHICSKSVKVSVTLANKLVFWVLRKRYDNFKIRLVADKILRAVKEDRLTLNDLLYIPTALPSEQIVVMLGLTFESKAMYKLIYDLSNNMNGYSPEEMIEYAEKLICSYYDSTQHMPHIDSLIVQELIRLHIIAHNKLVNKGASLKLIHSVMSTPITDKIDSSVLFSKNAKEKLRKKEYWYYVNANYISRMLISELKCGDDIKLDIIIRSGVKKLWWANAYKGNFSKLYGCTKLIDGKSVTALKAETQKACLEGEQHRSTLDATIKMQKKEFMNALFNEASNVEEFVKSLKVLLSAKDYTCQGEVIIASMVKIISKEQKLQEKLLKYNDFMIKKFGKDADLTYEHDDWFPNAWFFNFIFKSDWLDKSVNDNLRRIFKNSFHMKIISMFISELYLCKALSSSKPPTEAINVYISQNQHRFRNGGKIDNGVLIAEYIRVTKSASSIVKKIQIHSSYSSSMLPPCRNRENIFTNKMDHNIFKELSRVIENNRKKGFSRITTQKLMHWLLYACGNDFVLEAPQLLIDVAKTIKTSNEYHWFTEDLKDFHLPVSQELTSTIIETLLRVSESEGKNWLLRKVSNRVRALAEFDLSYQGNNCHAFKAGYILLRMESNINFNNSWTSQNLHLKGQGAEKMVNSIKSSKFIERVNAIMAIDSISLRCEVMLRFYVENCNRNQQKDMPIWEKICMNFEELAKALNSSDTDKIPITSIIKIFTILTKREIKIPNRINQHMLLGLVNFYQIQERNNFLGSYYKSVVKHVLDTIDKASMSIPNSKEDNKRKIYYALFTNKKATGKLYLECEHVALRNALALRH